MKDEFRAVFHKGQISRDTPFYCPAALSDVCFYLAILWLGRPAKGARPHCEQARWNKAPELGKPQAQP